MIKLVVIMFLLFSATFAQVFAEEPEAGIDTLIIPSINLATDIVKCPLVRGVWDTSQVWTRSCFLEAMSLPGTGNSVVAGHYDNNDGSPAIFYSLPSIRLGDEVTIYYQNERYDYLVTSIKRVGYKDLSPLFATGNQLTLLTSTGTYRSNIGRYDQVLVVVAIPSN